jgi:GGDEF domain-containing protein
MGTSSAQPFVRITDGSPAPEERFFVLGGEPPPIAGTNLHARIGSPCAGIILLNHIEPAELAAVLGQAPDPAVPIADFEHNSPLRHDFVGSSLNVETIAELKHRFAPVWRRLAELPFRAKREDREELTMLRLAYSRDAPIEAVFTPGSSLIVEYPLLGTAAGTRRHLELLADLDLLHRRHFTRTHACSKCGSARLHVYEACPGCSGADLLEETLVHHYRCGCQEPESHFAQGQLLICPKCRRVLHHLGVDYNKPGKIVVCRACGAVNSDPIIHFVCLDCATVTAAEGAASTDWYHYDLTDEGMCALRDGRLPRFEIAGLLERGTHAYSPHEFRLLAAEEMRVARQYQRPFAVARVSFPNIDAVRRALGPAATDVAVRHAVDAIVEAVRVSDFVGVGDATSVVIGFPETAATDIGPIEDRIRRTIHAAVVVPLELTVDVAEGDAIEDMLAEG